MPEKILGAGRVFASHYQFVLCADASRILSDEENWTQTKVDRGYAGGEAFVLFGTEADLNDHWIELRLADVAPSADHWQRITCAPFTTESGTAHVMSVIDAEPVFSARVPPGDYAAYCACQNLGIDQLSLGELDAADAEPLDDAAFAVRTDLEHYTIFLVPGRPTQTGRLHDEPA